MNPKRNFQQFRSSRHVAGPWPAKSEETFKILSATICPHGFKMIRTNQIGVIDVYKVHPYPCGHIHIKDDAKLHVDFGAYETEDAQLPMARHIDLDLHDPQSLEKLLAAMEGVDKFDGKVLGKNDVQTFHSRVSFE